MKKRWHLYINDIFEGYAPNRCKARGWATFGGTVVSEEKNLIIVIRGNDRYKAEYKKMEV